MMSSIRYIISDASKKIDVEPHVLRYWEEELDLDISRNEMGHRYYKEDDIDMLKTVKVLKDQGFQLKAIKMLLPDIKSIDGLDSQSILKLREELNEKAYELENKEGIIETGDGMSVTMFREKSKGMSVSSCSGHDAKSGVLKTEPDLGTSMNDKMGQFKMIMSNLIVSALKENNAELSAQVSGVVSDNVMKEMDYLLRSKEEREEERYKRLDETIRDYQKGRLEIAATKERKGQKKGIFRKKR